MSMIRGFVWFLAVGVMCVLSASFITMEWQFNVLDWQDSSRFVLLIASCFGFFMGFTHRRWD